jgi:hypothetical protein
VEEPPNKDRCRHHDQPERLVPPVESPLLCTPRLLFDFLEVRFDAAFNHAAILLPGQAFQVPEPTSV